MALLQLSEPGQSSNPHEHKLGIGIDLGTTRSLVAAVQSGKAAVIPAQNNADDTLLPSVVSYHKNGEINVGSDAIIENEDQHAVLSIRSVKRFMGRALSDINFSHPYPLSGSDDNMPTFTTPQGDKTPVEVSAEILKALVKRTEVAKKSSISGAVITVPAYFDEAQRHATRVAAELAGIDVLRLLNEPTAAAIAYGLDTNLGDQTKHYLIYDLGGGTFDVSILRLEKGVFEVLATGGHTALGGDDIDRMIVKWIKTQSQLKPTAYQQERLERYARSLKESLSKNNSVTARLPKDMGDWHANLTQEKLADITTPVIDITTKICDRVLRDAGLNKSALDEVVLVGGSTRMPAIKQAIDAFFNRTSLSRINPDEVVALGAAILANQLVGNAADQDKNILLDVTPLSLGLETMGGLVEKIIPRNTPIPVGRKQTFTTYQDGQTGMKIHILQGEREQVENCRSLGEFTLSGIPPMKAGVARIEVSFDIDADGLLSVSATETTTGQSSKIDVKPAYGLSESDQARLLEEGFNYAEQDKHKRAALETKVEIEREIIAIKSALDESGQLLTQNESAKMTDAMDELEALLSTDDFEKHIKSAESLFKQLKAHSDHFAKKIMNHSIKQSMAGSKADDWA